jgi:hypothetical protein
MTNVNEMRDTGCEARDARRRTLDTRFGSWVIFFMFMLLLVLSTFSSAQDVAVERATFRDWLSSGREHPGVQAIDRDLSDGRITRRYAVEQQLRLIAAPQTVAAKYAIGDEPVSMKCLTPLLIEAEGLGIDTGGILDAGMGAESVQNVEQFLISPMGLFEISFFLEGTHAINTTDANSNGIADYAEITAAAADSSFRHMVTNLGFKNPFPAKNMPIRVNIRSLSAGVYGFVSSFTLPTAAISVQANYDRPQFIKNDDENKAIGALKVTVAHELKHILQSVIIAPGMNPYSWIEMDATLMEEIVYDNVNDYYNYLNNSVSVFGNPSRSVIPGNYYHSSWALFFAERFGMEYWVEVWKRLENQLPSPNKLTAMDAAAAQLGTTMAREVTRNYLWHMASGANTRASYGFSEGSKYPNVKLDTTIVSPGTDVEIAVSLTQNYAARLYMLDYSNKTWEEGEGIRIYFKSNSGNQQFNVGLLAFYKDGTVEEFLPVRTSETELITTPNFDYTRLQKLGIAMVNTGGVSTSGMLSFKQQLGVNLVETNPDLPYQTAILPNYPNPFNPSTSIPIELARSGNVTVEVVDLLGRRVAVLADGFKSAGRHVLQFEAGGLSSGMYLVRMVSDAGAVSRKVMLLK